MVIPYAHLLWVSVMIPLASAGGSPARHSVVRVTAGAASRDCAPPAATTSAPRRAAVRSGGWKRCLLLLQRRRRGRVPACGDGSVFASRQGTAYHCRDPVTNCFRQFV